MIPCDDLTRRVLAYNPKSDHEKIQRAYALGKFAHRNDKRANGEPYFIHPIQVALILSDLKLDDSSIITALLHDVVEDTDVTLTDITRDFGQEVADLVDGVTKLGNIKFTSREQEQAENFRKLIIAVSEDARVLLVKLADRVHNMRTIRHKPLESRQRKARETLEVYAPLAGRMGMQAIREELEDLSFRELNPAARFSIKRRFVQLRRKHGDIVVEEVVQEIHDLLSEAGIKADVTGRQKRPYAIWRKLHEKDVSFEKMSDVVGFRAIVADESACYAALGAIHQKWRVIPGRFKDYISGPKANGYRSLHTSVIGPNGRRVEVQIRTAEMHEIAEKGVAAHWSYKNGEPVENRFAVDPAAWINDLIHKLGEGEQAQEFFEHMKAEMFLDQIFCLTPRGDVIGLPRGATALDFAYAVHTDIGNHCVGAVVDGRRQPLSTPLRSGQTVHVLTSSAQQHTADMEWMTVTGRAKAAIKRGVRARERREHAEEGERVVRLVFKNAGKSFRKAALEQAARKLGFSNTQELYARIWTSNLISDANQRPKPSAWDVLEAAYPDVGAEKKPDAQPTDQRPETPVSGLRSGTAFRYCRTCHPVPGDPIVGHRSPEQKRIVIHTRDCPRIDPDADDDADWVGVRWQKGEDQHADHLVPLDILLMNTPGALASVCATLGDQGANIDNISTVERHPDFFRMRIEVGIRDLRHVNAILKELEASSMVDRAERVRYAVMQNDAQEPAKQTA